MVIYFVYFALLILFCSLFLFVAVSLVDLALVSLFTTSFTLATLHIHTHYSGHWVWDVCCNPQAQTYLETLSVTVYRRNGCSGLLVTTFPIT